MSEIREYSKKQMNSALDLLEQYKINSSEEALHKLRVSLKKIKAVLQYLQTIHPSKTKKIKHSLRPLFREAGALRELRLRINWLQKKHYTKLIESGQLLKKLEKKGALFTADTDKWEKILIRNQKKLSTLTKKEHQHEIYFYVLSLKIAVEETPPKNATEWHEYRKLIKHLLYTLHWLSDAGRLNLLSVRMYKHFDKLQEAIGLWHDTEDWEHRLNDEQFYRHNDVNVKQEFKRCGEKIKIEKEQARKKVLLLLKRK